MRSGGGLEQPAGLEGGGGGVYEGLGLVLHPLLVVGLHVLLVLPASAVGLPHLTQIIISLLLKHIGCNG